MGKRKISLLLAVVLLVAAIAMGCSSSPGGGSYDSTDESANSDAGSDGKVKIGFSIQDISNPTWSEMYEQMEAKAEELGVEITLSDCQADPEKQISSIENFIQGGYDAIIIHCFDAESATSTIEDAKAKGIKVIAYDTYLEDADCYFGLDNYEVGKQIAKNASEFINEKFDNGECEIGVCNYPLNKVCLDRAVGIVDGLEEYAPNATIVAEAQAGYTDEGIEVGENFMQAHPNMKVVVGIGDAGLLGFYESVVAAGKTADDFGLFGIEGLDEVLRLIDEDTIFRSTIYLDLDTTGKEMVQSAVDLVEGKEVEKETYFFRENITNDNVGKYIDGNK